jgi:hypothetical protein
MTAFWLYGEPRGTRTRGSPNPFTQTSSASDSRAGEDALAIHGRALRGVELANVVARARVEPIVTHAVGQNVVTCSAE